jgi:hypothetical protein
MVSDSQAFNLDETLTGLESVDPVSATASFDVIGLLKPMQARAEAGDDEEAVKRLKWEQFLFSLQPMPLWTKRSGKYRLVCMLSYEGHEDEMARIPKEALLYFQTRLETCKSPMLVARYADVLWDRRDDSGLPPKDSAQYGRTASISYMSAAEAAMRVPDGHHSAMWYLNRAISVAVELGDMDLCKNVVASILTAIGAGGTPAYRGTAASFVETLLEVRAMGVGRQAVDDATLREAAKTLERLAATPLDTLDLSQHCLGKLAEVYRALGEITLVNKTKERLAATHVFWTDFLQPAMLWQSEEFEKAAALYRETGNTGRVAELMRRSRLANREATTRGEYKTITVPVEIDAQSLEEVQARFLHGEDVTADLRALARDNGLIPTAEDTRASALAVLNSNTLYARIRQSIMKGDRKSLETRNDEERVRFEQGQELQRLVLGVVHFVVSPVLAKLRHEKGLDHTKLVEFLVESSQLPGTLAGLVSAGLERYYAGDLTSAVYVLTPTVEGVVREILMGHGIDVTPPRGGGYRESMLGSMLAKPETEALFGKRLSDHFRFTLTDEEGGGMNLRNDVAHALLGPHQCDQTLADLVVHLHVLMTRFGQNQCEPRQE